MYRVIDLHCDTIPNMYSDFREGKGDIFASAFPFLPIWEH